MNLILTVLNIVGPVMILAAIGYGWSRLGYDYPISFVTQLAMTFAVPCLIFVALMSSQIETDALAELTLASLVGYVAIALVFLAVLWMSGLSLQTFLAPLTFGNTGNLGLPLALFAFGDDGLGYAVVVFAVTTILAFTVGAWVVAGAGSLTRMLREPIVWATVLGGVFVWQGWQTPLILTNALELVGQMAIPLMLITLGVALARLQAQSLGRALGLAVLKLGVCVAVAFGVATVFALDPIASAVLIVQLATPVAVTSYLLAQKYGADGQAVASLVVVSTLLAVVSLPLILSFVI